VFTGKNRKRATLSPPRAQHLAEEVEEGGSGRRVEAHDHLQAGVYKAGE